MRRRPDLLEASGPEDVHLSFRCKVISCMSEYLLLVSEALATEHFENCTVVSHRNHWPKMGELQRLAARQSRFLRRWKDAGHPEPPITGTRSCTVGTSLAKTGAVGRSHPAKDPVF